MAITGTTADPAVRVPWQHTLRPARPIGNVPVSRAVLFAGHAECPSCGAFVRLVTPLGPGSVVGEVVAAWCDVCCMTTYFAPIA